jgi:isopenicillin N synthase-like dioxygenase
MRFPGTIFANAAVRLDGAGDARHEAWNLVLPEGLSMDESLQVRTRGLDRGDLSARKANFETIPVIDIAGLYSDDLSDRRAVARAVGEACRNVGFFYIRNHRIPDSQLSEVYRVADAYYRLPMDRKLQCDINRLGRHRGYVAIGGLAADSHDGTAFDLHEAYEVSLELPETDPDFLAGNLMYGPNVWPDEPVEFRSVVYRYYESVLDLGRTLFRCFALALDLPEHWFDDKITKPMAQLRVLHYPPQTGEVDPKHLGVGAHTDYECFTILAQSAPGLQVRNSLGQWIEAPPLPGTFVINIGDVMSRWTNDLFASTVHRVINTTGRRRFSLPFFFGADYDAEVRCLASCQSADRPPRYAPISAGECTVQNITAAYAYRKPGR